MRPFALWLLITITAMSATTARADNRDALRQILQDQCVKHWREQHDPTPCVRVNMPSTADAMDGVAVLPDRKGGAHFLLIPLATISGIESKEVLTPNATNYFAAAWQARDVLATEAGRHVERSAIGLAVNPQTARGQDQLHIHIECLKQHVYETLRANAEHIGSSWSPLIVSGSQYQAMRVMGEELGYSNPFALLADRLANAPDSMGAYTLVVVGMEFEPGPGFVLLAGTAVPNGETLLDSTCAVARLPA